MEWISVKDRLPEIKKGQITSERVFAWCDNMFLIMAYAKLGVHEGLPVYAWCNCYGEIDGRAEFDDNYSPTHWMPLPPPPKK